MFKTDAFSGKTAIVTGVSNGIGRAIAVSFLQSGADVFGLDIVPEGLESLAAEADAFAGAFTGIETDAGDVDAINAAFDQIQAKAGQIDILVNNAGVTRRANVMELDEADWDRIFRVNAKGVFFCLQRAARAMIDQGSGGRIINIASIAGKGYRNSSNAIYAGSKGAVITMTKLAAGQLGEHDITVNSVCPGITETEIYQGIIERDAKERGTTPEEVHAIALKDVPMGRGNTTDEVAAMVLYLASPAARNVTGQAFNIDGGTVMN